MAMAAALVTVTMASVLAEVTPRVADVGWKGVTWQNLNPGAGGNIQSIALDPNTPGRLFYCSDMEGHYRSDDYGETWRYVGADLSYSYVNCVAVEPGNARRVYTGTRGSLEISDEEGLHWRRVERIADCIGQVAVRPDRPEVVFALPGRRHRWNVESRDAGLRGPQGDRDFYLSNDRGVTWNTVKYDAQPGRRDILSFDFMPGHPEVCYLGALTGIYRSRDGGKTWQRLPSPPAAGDCLGAALSPEGQVLYASYRVPFNGNPAVRTTGDGGLSVRGWSHLFATRLEPFEWRDLSKDAPGFELAPRGNHATMFWRPRVDPRSTALRHRLVIGTYRPHHGLWEVNVQWPAGAAAWRRALWYENSIYPNYYRLPFDIGWEHWGVTAEDYHFAPPSWNKPLLFSTAGQTLYRAALAPSRSGTGDSSETGMPVGGPPAPATLPWQPIYCWQVSAAPPVRFYRSRGAQSTFVFDVAAHGDYVVQCNADNCILESFDGGYSWTMDTKPGKFTYSRSNSVALLEELDPPLVVAHLAVGWGSNNEAATNSLWAKRLVHHSPEDEWVQIAGGEERLAGLYRDEYTCLAPDPRDPRRLAVGLRFGGVFMIEDVEALYEAARAGNPLPKVGSPTKGVLPPKPTGVATTGTGMAFDPLDSSVLWVAGPNAFWRGKQAGDTWTWTQLLHKPSVDFAAWSFQGKTCLVVAREDRLDWSRDGGRTWAPLLDFAAVKPLRSPAWYRPDLQMRALGLVAHSDELFFCYCTGLDRVRPYGLFRAKLNDTGVVRLEDLTADLPFAYPVRARLIANEGRDYLYLCTRGCGVWRRELGL